MRRFLIHNFYFLLNPIRIFYWFLFRPKTKGVKCVIECEGKFLLEHLGYAHKKWTIPGGGVKRGESWEDAARREVFEEVGIRLEKIEKIGEFSTTKQYKRDHVEVFYAKVSSPHFKIDGIEVVEAGWFAPQELPPERSPNAERLVKVAIEVKKLAHQ